MKDQFDEGQADWQAPSAQPSSASSSASWEETPPSIRQGEPRLGNPYSNPHPKPTRHRSRTTPIIATVCTVVMIAAMLLAGFAAFSWRRSTLGGSSVICKPFGDDPAYCIGGIKPVQASGPTLTMSQAGPYFTDAISAMRSADDAVRLAAIGGDLNLLHNKAAAARTVAEHTVQQLAARTWPSDIRTAVNMVILDYQERQSIYANLAANTNREAVDRLAIDGPKSSGAESLIRTQLGLQAAPFAAVPVTITSVKDAGSCEGYDGGNTVTQRCLDVTVTNEVPVAVTDIALRMTLVDPDGTIRSSDAVTAYSDVSDTPIAAGQSVTLEAQIDPSLVQSGSTLTAGRWAVTDTSNQYHSADFGVGWGSQVAALRDFAFE